MCDKEKARDLRHGSSSGSVAAPSMARSVARFRSPRLLELFPAVRVCHGPQVVTTSSGLQFVAELERMAQILIWQESGL